MKKNITSALILFILIFITIQILLSSTTILSAVSFSFEIWKNSIFPSLFPFFVLSEILINYGLPEFISELFKPVMQKVFKISGPAAYVFIMGMISGFPASAKYTKELLNQGLINDKEATKILMFTHFSSPLFILSAISITFLNNRHIGFLILICHYITNIFIGLLFRNYNCSSQNKSKFSFISAINKMTDKRLNNDKSFGEIISIAIINGVNSLLSILGTITFFLIITSIINLNLNLNEYYQVIINGIFEMTQGLKYISILELPLKLKTIISTMFISFGGLSVHVQIISILNGTKIKYLPFFLSRLLHCLLSGLLIFILFEFWINLA